MRQALRLAAFAAASFGASSNAQRAWGHGGHGGSGGNVPQGGWNAIAGGRAGPPASYNWWFNSTSETTTSEPTTSSTSTSSYSSETSPLTSTSVEASPVSVSTTSSIVLSTSYSSTASDEESPVVASSTTSVSLSYSNTSTTSSAYSSGASETSSTSYVVSPVSASTSAASDSTTQNVSTTAGAPTETASTSTFSSPASTAVSASAETFSVSSLAGFSKYPTAPEAYETSITATYDTTISLVSVSTPAASSAVVDSTTSSEEVSTVSASTASSVAVSSAEEAIAATSDATTTSVVFATASVTVSSCEDSCSASATPVSVSTLSPAAIASAYSAAFGSAQSSLATVTPSTTTSSSSYAPSVTAAYSEAFGSAEASFQSSPGSSTTTSSASTSSVSTAAAGASSPTSTTTLTNYEQVGNSTFGTLEQPPLPYWLNGSGGPDYITAPWGNLTNDNSDATIISDVPVTNVTRYYNFTLSRSRVSADGVLRDVILVNDQFPAPLIEANWGDWIQVTVNNNIFGPDEGTTLHWHGLLLRNTPWADGVPGIGQCPIASGHSLTYKFQAETYGTSWYHSHYSAQMAAGLTGPVVVHGPTQLPYDIDIGPVMLSDWYHIPYFAIVADAVGTNYSLIPPTSDSLLINGRGRFDCADGSYSQQSELLASDWDSNITWTCVDNAPLSQFRFQSGKVHRLRLINHGANGVQKFSIDGHNMTVIATDFVPTVPYSTNTVTLGVGQRTDVLVTATNYTKGAVWMRTQTPGGEVCGASDHPEAIAAIYYEDADITVEPTTYSSLNETSCLNDDLFETSPEYSITPSNDSWIQDLALDLALNDTGHFEFRINGISYKTDFNSPLLPQVIAGNYTFEPEWNVYNFENNRSIILNITNNMPLTHPFHMHGHNFFVLNFGDNTSATYTTTKRAEGPIFSEGATWDGTVINPSNPMRRDTVLVPAYGFAAIQFELDNPGLWPFHCHIAWHLSAGQAMNIMYRPQDMPPLPEYWTYDACVNWDWYSEHNEVNQIDSGG